MELGRNDLCWCGSGKKFKHCHLDRDKLSPFTIEDLYQKQKKALDIKVCFAENFNFEQCSGGIIKAHSLSKKASIERIAQKQHVYGFNWSIKKIKGNGRSLVPKKFGIREASTFTGFCQKHDGVLFKPLDTAPFLPTSEQIGLLMYRVLCREIMGKMRMAQSAAVLRDADRGRKFLVQHVTQHNANIFNEHVLQTLPELQSEREKWQAVIENQSFENVSYAVIRFDSIINLVCAGISQPNIDFNNRMLLDLNVIGTRQDNVIFALLPSESSGVAVFGWLGYFKEAEEFANSLLNQSEKRITNQLVRYAFETFDNVWLSPDWWENLPKPEQDFLIERMNIGGMPYEAGTGDPYSLQDNGMDFVDWKIVETKTSFVRSS